MAFWENVPHALRSVFDDGLDEVLIFAVVFIFILLSGHETNEPGGYEDNTGILPLLIIGAFLVLFAGLGRSEEDIV
jgi:hypothetical protein